MKKVKKGPARTNGTSASTNGSAAKVDTKTIVSDYRTAVQSREASYLGRRQVLSGKAKFGIFGDGKEVAQLAMARAFQPGDWRSGYYRDQTFMFAIGESDVRKFFAQLYAHTDVVAEPASAGRSMNGHFATRFIDDNGKWLEQSSRYNVSADVSPTGSQMPRLVGLAQASKIYRNADVLHDLTAFSKSGNEVAFGTIGNASCAEGMFWESVNAIGVLGVPAVISIWDDGYGISVPNNLQVTKSNVGELLSGFQRAEGTTDGFDVHVVRAWDYPALVDIYLRATEVARRDHVPQIIHVIEVTQPQGHSTSGSHERYKTPERLQWEKEYDGIKRMRDWILAEGIATEVELAAIDAEAVDFVKAEQQAAFDAYMAPIREELSQAQKLITELVNDARLASVAHELHAAAQELSSLREPFRRDIMAITHRVLVTARSTDPSTAGDLAQWRKNYDALITPLYSSWLTDESPASSLTIGGVDAVYADDAPSVNGSEIINSFFHAAFSNDPRIVIFGEDAGKLGDVNQGTVGLQAAFGEQRVSDTGIREATILGQAIGLAMRGLRPIAEIQYLDYLLYALQLMSDDLATVTWRTKGGQKAPVIVRTRGHRLEGIWHSGSPMAGILNLVRGVHVCVPRNFVQAVGMYTTLLRGDDPGLVVEVLNGYRLKERMPSNIGNYTVELGRPDIIRPGTDITLVTYGATVRVAQEAAITLSRVGVDVEIVDVQTLLPFDRHGVILSSLKKTNRLLVVDEDVPGGASAFILREVIETHDGFRWLDSAPRTLTAKEHRPAYGTDGNYWSKPEAEHIFDAAYAMMREAAPKKYPELL